MGCPRKEFDAGLPDNHGSSPHLGNQRNLLKRFDIDTPAEENVRNWNTFWAAPLVVPGGHDTTDLPRSAGGIQRASVSYNSHSCRVTSNGSRV
jgi:hypothetical protein